jgi:hypothetical protein
MDPKLTLLFLLIGTINTATYDDRSRCRLAIEPLGHTGVTDRQETHEMA